MSGKDQDKANKGQVQQGAGKAGTTGNQDETRIAGQGEKASASAKEERTQMRPSVHRRKRPQQAQAATPAADEATQMRPKSAAEEATQIRPKGAAKGGDDDATQMAPARKKPPVVTQSDTQRTDASLAEAISNTQRELDGQAASGGASKIINRRFVLGAKLGAGGMGSVYKAKDLRKVEAQDRNPWVAIKLLNDAFKEHPSAFISLQREARKTQGLAHPSIVRVYDFDRDGDTVYMTMELLEGQDLNRIIKENPAGMTKEDAFQVVRDVGGALVEAHSHDIIHSDFKPGNIFYTDDKRSKVFDFGIARAASNLEASEDGEDGKENTVFDAGSLGALTPAYASFEMLEGEEPSQSDDLYALGCVAYETLTGRHPFGKTPANKAMAQGLKPKQIEGLKRREWKALRKAIAFKREDRYATIDEFLNDYLPERNKLGKVAKFAIAAMVVALVGGGVFYQQQQQQLQEEKQKIALEQERIKKEKRIADEKIRLENERIAAEKAKTEAIEKLKKRLDDDLEALASKASELQSDLDSSAFISASSDTFEWQLSVRKNISALGNVYKEANWSAPYLETYTDAHFQPVIQVAADKYDKTSQQIESWLKGYHRKVSNIYLDQAGDKIVVSEFADAQKMIGLARQYHASNTRIPDVQRILSEALAEQRRIASEAARELRMAAYSESDITVAEELQTCASNLALKGQANVFSYDMPALQQRLSKLSNQYADLPEVVFQGNLNHVSELSSCIQLYGLSDPKNAEARMNEARGLFPEYLAAFEGKDIRPYDSCQVSFAGKGRRYTCSDRFIENLSVKGPELVVIPGNDEISTLAIGKYEVTEEQFNAYCQATGECNVTQETGVLPASGRSVQEYTGYVKWLSQQTGFEYRIPTKDEWHYAATARSSDLDKDRNCHLEARGIAKGLRLLPFDIGVANNWGIINHVGNVQEVVVNNNEYLAVGGSRVTPMEACKVESQGQYTESTADVTGLRVLRVVN